MNGEKDSFIDLFRKELHLPDVLKRDLSMPEALKRDITVPEALKRDLSMPEALKRDINIPESLKREIPVGDFLGREISFRRKRDGEIDQVKCFACGHMTPSTVSHCLHCDAVIEQKASASGKEEKFAPIYFNDSSSLVDMDL
jgi:hypothetical protein